MTEILKAFGRIAVAASALSVSMVTGAMAWSNAEGEEDWGQTCFLEQDHNSGYIQILTNKGSFNPAMLISNTSYPAHGSRFSVNFDIEGGSRFERSGTVDDYFGQVYIELNRDRFDRLSAGRSMVIDYPGASIYVPLSEPGAFSAFLACAGEMASGDRPAAPTKPKSSFWN